MIKKSYAKINLAINVKSRLDNNYHDLDMIMVKVNLFDKLYFSKMKEDKVVLTCTNNFIPTDEKNLVYKVILKVKEVYQIKEGIKVHIIKIVPTKAGLGGGSSNAACTLEALNEMFSLNLSLQEKIDFTKDLGSDIAFFYYNSMARAQGQGEIITKIKARLDDFYVALIKPQRGLSTRQVYENIDYDTIPHPNINELIQAIENNDYEYMINNIDNSLQASAIKLRPDIALLQAELKDLKVDCSLVSGSGSTIFAFTKDKQVVENIKKAHINKKNFIYITKLMK